MLPLSTFLFVPSVVSSVFSLSRPTHCNNDVSAIWTPSTSLRTRFPPRRLRSVPRSVFSLNPPNQSAPKKDGGTNSDATNISGSDQKMRGHHGGGRHGGTESTPLLGNRADQEPVSWRDTWATVSPFLLPKTFRLRVVALVSLLCVFLRKIVNLIPPYMFKLAVDQLTQDAVNKIHLVPVSVLVFFIVTRMLTSLLNGIQDYTYSHVAANNTTRFSVVMFEHLQNLSLAFHLKRKTGEITRIMDRGVSSMDTLTNSILFTLIPTIFEAGLVTTIFLKLGTPSIAITTFVTVITYFLFTFAFTNFRIRMRRDLIEADNLVSSKAVDTIMNYETVKSFGMEREETTEYNRLQTDYQSKYVNFRGTLMLLNFGQATIQTIGLGIAVIFAAFATASGRLSAGDFVLVNSYVGQLFQPLFFLGSVYRQLTQAATDLEKCVKLLKEDITVKDAPDSVDFKYEETDVVERRVGEVVFDNVSFKYQGNERGESGGLQNISFTTPASKMIAFVGASGVGKSTLMRLLLRFYDVDSGSVLIDGQNVRSLTQTSLRKQVGVVAQDTVLFNSSLRDNISYGKQDATDADIFEAAKSAALGPFVQSLPEGLDTIVGERGVRLSGGERQRVGVARCIIKNPAIILLDEATSALDTHTEREMQKNLREVCKNRTTLMVAHRLSTIMMADEIIVLIKSDDGVGSVGERGSHEELLTKKGGLYAEMWEKQTNVATEDEDTETEIESEISHMNGSTK